jgi:hypothetical protein
MGFLEKLRKWIDGESNNSTASEEKLDAGSPGQVSEEFLILVAREVESVMRRERFTPPGGQTYIPRQYALFLSVEDNRKWPGEKREGMHSWLAGQLSQRIHKLSQGAVSAAKLEILTDPTLRRGEFRVYHLWDNRNEEDTTSASAGETEDQTTNVRALISKT